MNSISTTNRLLLIMVIPLVFYLLKTLSFIFIPLFFSMFIALLYLPLMRWLGRKKVPQTVALVAVVGIIVGFLFLGGQLVKISINEILSANSDFFVQAEQKLIELIGLFESFLGIDHISEDIVLKHYMGQLQLFDNFGSSINMVGDTITMTLMTAFFVVLFLAGSINLQDVMQTVLFKQKYASVKTFRKVEKDIIKFVWVKFVISLFTGIGFSLACVAFDVSFPIFWGMFAFLINFVQMVGSVISIVALSIFAIVELDPSGTLLAFVLIITGVQVLMGSILEPIFMGKTFSINVITVLVMLWGYLWGVPGLIMSIPITVFLKIVLEHFPKTKSIARLMSGSQVS